MRWLPCASREVRRVSEKGCAVRIIRGGAGKVRVGFPAVPGPQIAVAGGAGLSLQHCGPKGKRGCVASWEASLH